MYNCIGSKGSKTLFWRQVACHSNMGLLSLPSDPFGNLNVRMVLRYDGGSVLSPEGDRYEDPGQSGLHN